MAETIEKTTVEITEKDITAAPELPTREELRVAGLSARELDMAEAQGKLRKEEKAPEPKAEVKTEEPAKVPEAKTEAHAVPAKPKGAIPTFEMTEAQEKVFLESFGPGTEPRALYFRMKNERRDRQKAQDEAKAVRAELEAMKAAKATPVPEDDENAPLTAKRLREIEQKREAEYLKAQEEQQVRAQRVSSALKEQEEYVKAVLPDFDATVGLAKEVMNNLQSLGLDPAAEEEATELIQRFFREAARADEFSVEGLNPSRLAYKIGQFHPNYGKSPAAPTKETGISNGSPKANGGLTPEQMKRAEQNTQRRGSSAAVPAGGGKRTVAAEDVGLAELNAMNLDQRTAFKTKFPDRYAQLLRG